jgi:AcrR family transcriptional regulator
MTARPRRTSVEEEVALGLREQNKRRRADRILAAALDLLREDPDQNVSVERIAQRAHVAPMTVFNLVGNRDEMWRAVADRALGALDLNAIAADDPHERARQIVDAVVGVLTGDAEVFRALLSRWIQGGGLVLEHDPTDALVACLREAAEAGIVAPDANVRRYAEIIATGLIGTIHQWTSGLLSERGFRARAREIVDVVFVAAAHRPPHV